MKRLIIALLAALVAAPALAQKPPPARPQLPVGADVNDWEVYFDAGAALFAGSPAEAEPYFYWASRLNPARAEPLFALWAAYWGQNGDRWRDYLQSTPRVMRMPAVMHADSLRFRAMVRNPFVHQGLIYSVVDRLPGYWGADTETQAYLSYAAGDFPRALDRFTHALSRDSARTPMLWLARARTYAAMGRLDEASGDLTRLVGSMRAREQKRLVNQYDSKEFFQYGIGLLQMARRNYAAARDALSEALVEDMSYYPAHMALADVAMAQGDAQNGLREYAQAVELGGDDAVLRFRYGVALLAARQVDPAIEQLRAAIAAEPFFAEPYYHLGAALEAKGDRAGALAAYRGFLEHASRTRDAALVARANARLQALPAAQP